MAVIGVCIATREATHQKKSRRCDVLENNEVKLGYELGTDSMVSIPQSHLIVTGISHRSGKTTSLQALIKRSGKKAIVFTTKIGEAGFTEGKVIAPYLVEKSDWMFVEKLFEATLKEKFKFERGWTMEVCKGTKCLKDVKRNIDTKLKNDRLNQISKNVYISLSAYLEIILQHMGDTKFSKILQLHEGINIMDLENFKEEIQSLVIKSVLETILTDFKDTIVVIPEAWKFLPQGKGNPCKYAAESFIRQGATNGNFMWIDSQDMAGVDKGILKQVSTWILGLQQERNEVEHTLDQIPLPKQQRPVADNIMTLQLGQFYVCTPNFTKKTYVQPAWVDDETAICISKGLKNVDELVKPQTNIEYDTEVKKKPDEKKEIKVDNIKPIEIKMLEAAKDCTGAVLVRAEENVMQEELQQLKPEIPNQNKPQLDIEVLAQRVVEILTSSEVSKALDKKIMINQTKQKILEEINWLNADEKRVLVYLELQQKGIGINEISEQCLRREKIYTMFKRLEGIGTAKYDSKKNLCSSTLKEKVRNALAQYKLKENEIEQVYESILKDVAENG